MRVTTGLCALLAACAAAAKPVPSTPSSAGTSQAVSRGPSAPPTRELGADARFADLLMQISGLEAHASAGDGCLLGRRGEGFHLGADLATALHPLAAAPSDLDGPLKRTPTVRLLSRWGQYGAPDGEAVIALAALSASPPTREAHAILVTDQGLYLRPSAPGADGALGPVADVPSLLRVTGTAAQTSWFVAAEAEISVRRLVEVLEALSTRVAGPVILATALPADTPLPSPVSDRATPDRCPEGLPPSDGPEGELDVDTLRASLGALRDTAAACLERADARGAAGGKVEVALRIDASGHLARACIQADETGDSALLSCVLQATAKLSFPAPQPSGTVDVALPLVLRPNSAPAQRTSCPPIP